MTKQLAQLFFCRKSGKMNAEENWIKEDVYFSSCESQICSHLVKHEAGLEDWTEVNTAASTGKERAPTETKMKMSWWSQTFKLKTSSNIHNIISSGKRKIETHGRRRAVTMTLRKLWDFSFAVQVFIQICLFPRSKELCTSVSISRRASSRATPVYPLCLFKQKYKKKNNNSG